MLSPRGQAGLEAKILSLDSASKICPRPRAFVLGLFSNFLFWPRENECNDITPQICDCHQRWSIRSISWIFPPGHTCTRLPSSATTCLSRVLCACKFCPSWENFLSKRLNHVGTQSTRIKCCPRDTGLLEVQFSLVGHGRSLQSSLWF